MIDAWRDVFDEAFPRNEKHRVRNFASTALEARNATSHLSLPLQDDEAIRYLDAMHHLAPRGEGPGRRDRGVEEALRCATAIWRLAPVTAGPAPTDPAAAPKLDLPTPAEEPRASAKGLKPWIDVALPHPDVLANRFKEAEFAADLFAVDAGHATEDYAALRRISSASRS